MDEGFISDDSNYQLNLPKRKHIAPLETLIRTFPLHTIQGKCVYLKHKQSNQHNQKYYFNGLLIDNYNKEINKQIEFTNNIFDSSFESGNLYAAYEIKQNEYDLILQDDINTEGYAQWFYFGVNNNTQNIITFNIVNLVKQYTQFKDGILIYILHQGKWQLLQSHVKVKESQYYKFKNINSNITTRQLYTLSFKVKSNYTNYRLALNQPYSYYDLMNYLNSINHNTYQYICKSLQDKSIPILTFGNQNKETIFIIARQHPGETVSSFVCQGIIECLKKDQSIYQLSQYYYIIIIPMFNPDGVISGNFRCELSGRDINRVWQRTNENLYIQVQFCKELIQSLSQQIICFIDLHGHSKKYNTFMYCCRGDQDVIESRVLPGIMQRNSKYFDFDSCTFSLEPCKMKTARAFAYKLLKKINQQRIYNIFTLETSFFGYNNGININQFNQKDLIQIGKDLYKSLVQYFLDQEIHNQIKKELELNREQYIQKDLMNIDDEGSDSEGENAILIKKNKKKKQLFAKKQSVVVKDNRMTGFFKKNSQAISNNQMMLNNINENNISQELQNQTPLRNQINQIVNNFVNARYASQPKSKLENRAMKSQSVHQQFLNLTQKEQQFELSPINNKKIHTQQSNNVNQDSFQEYNNLKIQKETFINSIKHQTKRNQIRLSDQSYKQVEQQLNNSQNLVVISKSIQKKDTWDPRLIFEFTQKVKRKNTNLKFY